MIVVRPVTGLPEGIGVVYHYGLDAPDAYLEQRQDATPPDAPGPQSHTCYPRARKEDRLGRAVIVAVRPREADAAALGVEEAVVVLHEVRP